MSATSGKPGTLRVSALQVTFHVRREIDPRSKRILRDLYSSGKTVDPIEVYEGTTIIHDGRTRRAALLELGWQDREINVVFIQRPRSRLQQHAGAMSRNWGGPQPTSYEDILFVFRQHLRKREPEGRIRDAYEFIPRRMLRQYLKDARSQNSRANIEAAQRLVAAGAEIPVAAKQCGIDEGKLRERCSGGNRKHVATGAGEIKAALSSQIGSHTLRMGNHLKHVFELCEDEDMPVTDGLNVITHLEALVRRAIPFVQEWKERIAALNGDNIRRPRKVVIKLPKKKARAKAKKTRHLSAKAA